MKQYKYDQNTETKDEEKGECGSPNQQKRMAQNMLQLNVFFQTLNVQTITVNRKYEVYNLSFIGIKLGFSIILGIII